MTTPTIPQVESWNPQSVIDAGTAITKAGADLATRLAEVDLAVDKTALDWKGEAGAAASMRAVSELLTAGQAKRAATTIGEAMQYQAGVIAGYRSAILNTRDSAVQQHGMTVAPDGTVTAPSVPGSDDDSFRYIVQGRLNRQAADFQTSIKENLAHCGTALAAMKLSAALGLTDLDQHGGPGGATVGGATISGASGKALGTQIQDAVADGKPIPTEVLDQLTEDLRATGIPPEQLQSYLNGETTTIPASAQQYLKELYGAAGADGFTAASQQLQSQGPTGQQAAASLANGVLMLSNEKVGTGRDADGKLTGAGNYENLPQDMRDLISTRNYGADPSSDGFALDSEQLQQQAQLLEALSQAEPGNEPGTKMSTELIRQGAQLAWIQEGTHGSGHPLPSIDNGTFDNAVNNAVELGARNTDGAHAILTGQGGPEILGSGYHPDTALMPLLRRDDGTAMGSLTDWIARDAHTTDSSVPDATRAGQAARGLAEIISTTNSADGTNNYTTLLSGDGKIGNGTADQIAEALAPYVGDMAGMPDNLTQTLGFGELGSSNNLGGPVEPLRVFSILDSDDSASQIINGTALAESQRMDRLFATTGNAELGTHAYRLQWLVDHGLSTEMDQRIQDGVDEKTANADRNSKFNTAWTASQIVAGGMGPVGIGVAAGSEFLKPFVLSTDDVAAPTPRDLTLDTSQFKFDNLDSGTNEYKPSEWGSPGFRKFTVLSTLVENGSINLADVPDVYKNADGTGLAKYSDVDRQFAQINDSALQKQAMLTANTLIADAGISNIDEYSKKATGDTQRNLLSEAIRPPGNNPSREDILKWLASGEASRSSDNRWPTAVL